VTFSQVTKDAPADRAGLKAGDVVVSIDGAAAATVEAFSKAIRAHYAGDRLKFVVERAGQNVEIEAVLGTRD
jgi:S1-C subfamily serine protease